MKYLLTLLGILLIWTGCPQQPEPDPDEPVRGQAVTVYTEYDSTVDRSMSIVDSIAIILADSQDVRIALKDGVFDSLYWSISGLNIYVTEYYYDRWFDLWEEQLTVIKNVLGDSAKMAKVDSIIQSYQDSSDAEISNFGHKVEKWLNLPDDRKKQILKNRKALKRTLTASRNGLIAILETNHFQTQQMGVQRLLKHIAAGKWSATDSTTQKAYIFSNKSSFNQGVLQLRGQHHEIITR